MHQNKSDYDLSAAEYRDPVIDQLLAGNISSYPEQGVPPFESTDVIQEISTHLRKALDLCEAQLSATVRSPLLYTPELPQQLAAQLVGATSEIEQLLYAFMDNTGLDLYETLRFFKKSQDAPRGCVTVTYHSGALLVYMPSFPKKGQGNTALVNQMLAAELLAMTDMPSWPKWQAAFYHVYPSGTSDIPKDVDNYDYKKTIDLLAYAVRSSDSSLNFSMKMDTVFTDVVESGVYIHVMKKSSELPDFALWQRNEKSF